MDPFLLPQTVRLRQTSDVSLSRQSAVAALPRALLSFPPPNTQPTINRARNVHREAGL